MGIIQRQGLKYSIVQYLGVGVGLLATLFVYPLAPDAYGLVQFLKSTALLFLPIANLGVQNLTIRFFPEFKTDDHTHNGFLRFLLSMGSLAFLLFASVVFLFWDPIVAYYSGLENEYPELPVYLWYVIPLVYLLLLINILTSYISNFHRIVVPAILHDLFIKFCLPVLILLYYTGRLGPYTLVKSFILVYACIVLFLLVYLHQLGGLRWSRPTKKIWQRSRAMADFAGFGILGGLGGMLALQLDVFMLGSYSTFANTGIYSIGTFIATAISIPQKSILNISAPIVAGHWEKKDLTPIDKLYQQTSLVLLMVGIFLFILIAINFPTLCLLLPKGEELIKVYYVVLFLGFGRLVDMGTSINGQIIQYSASYRMNVYFILALGLFNILLNIILIPRYGIEGAAVATCISLILYNLLRTLYVKFKYGIQPFQSKTFQLLLISGMAVLPVLVLPDAGHPFVNLIYKSLLFATCFLVPTILWNISTELNGFLQSLWMQLKNLFGQ